jgi:DNA-binding transcriptional regulator GbsR (MarR family)
MTENKMALTPVMRKFVLHWGEMGTRWGINRTVAQVHALLFISPQALNAEQISETLEVARSNVSSCLRELQGWGIVRIVHQLGDRRDYFESMKDVWEMFRVVVEERKRREIDPTLVVLRECVEEENRTGSMDPVSKQRLSDLLSFLEAMTGWYEQLRKWPTSSLMRLMKMGDRVRKFLEMKSK